MLHLNPDKSLTEELLNRYQDRVDRRGLEECWNWTGQTNNWGYGVVTIQRQRYPVHRVFYEMLVGPIPDGMVVDHECRNHLCVNTRHLQAIPKGTNIALGRLRNTHCPHGHEFSSENVSLTKQGHRRCKVCQRRQSLRGYYVRKLKELDDIH